MLELSTTLSSFSMGLSGNFQRIHIPFFIADEAILHLHEVYEASNNEWTSIPLSSFEVWGMNMIIMYRNSTATVSEFILYPSAVCALLWLAVMWLLWSLSHSTTERQFFFACPPIAHRPSAQAPAVRWSSRTIRVCMRIFTTALSN